MRRHHFTILGALALVLSGAAHAQENPSVSVEDGAKRTPPNPGHVPFTLPKDIPWQGQLVPCKKQPCWWGDQTYMAFGDWQKPGIYGQVVKWPAGRFSKPHFHNKERYVVVLSGTWWVSSSNKQDMGTLYPFPAGTIARDVAGTVHWDGAMAGGEDAVVMIVGEGPVSSMEVDANGKPMTAPDPHLVDDGTRK